jgi:hypothetical protein
LKTDAELAAAVAEALLRQYPGRPYVIACNHDQREGAGEHRGACLLHFDWARGHASRNGAAVGVYAYTRESVVRWVADALGLGYTVWREGPGANDSARYLLTRERERDKRIDDDDDIPF